MTNTCNLFHRAGALVAIGLLATLLVACTPSATPTQSSLVAAPTIGVTIVTTQDADPSPAVTETQQAAQSSATAQIPAAASGCPPVSPSPTLPPPPATLTDTLAALTSYLEAGATVNGVADALKTWGFIYTPPNSHDQLGDVRQVSILPGNDAQIIATYYDPSDKQTVSRHGDLVVLKCAGGTYQVAYQASADPDFGGSVLNPRVFSTQDVTGDGLGDLSFLAGDCGANTCLDGVYILTAVDGALKNAIPDFEWVPFPTFGFVPPAKQGSQAQDLIVHVGYFGSPGAGPQRILTETWTYVAPVFTLTLSVKEPPVYRIHALHDGDDAFRRKDFATANALYQRVANDASLQSWDGNTPLRDEPRILAAFAYVRLMETAAAAGDSASLQAAHEALTVAGSAASPGAIFGQLGDAFLSAYNQTHDYGKACGSVITYAGKNQNTYQVLGQETFGYANADYQANDMCITP